MRDTQQKPQTSILLEVGLSVCPESYYYYMNCMRDRDMKLKYQDIKYEAFCRQEPPSGIINATILGVNR